MTYQYSGSPRFEERVPPADLDHDFTNLNLGSRPISLRTNSTNHSSSPNKDYLLYQFKRTGDGWYGANRAQVPVAQEALKKLAGKGGKSTREQLRRMGDERREEIQALISELDAQEPEGAHWEPVYLETKASKITDNRTRKVSAFDVVIHRRTKSVDKDKAELKRRQSSTGSRPTKIISAQTRPKPQIHMPPLSPVMGSKPPREDPFGEVRLFSPQGFPIDQNGTVPFEKGGKHADMQFERPISSIAPHFKEAQEKKEKEKEGRKDKKSILDEIDLDSLIDGKNPLYEDDDDEVLIVDDGHRARTGGSAEAAKAAKARLRRASSTRHRNVAYETREPLHHSNRSSWASSDQASVFFGELDERSSMTSDETRGSDRPAKYHRYSTVGVPRASVSRSPGGQRRYYIEEPAYNSYERRHRRMSSNDSGRRAALGYEQPVRVHHSPLSNSPIVHQRPREFREERIPPIAPEVLAYRNQARISEPYIDDYIRNDRRQEVEPRYAPRGTRPSFVEVGQRNRSSYTFEPRNQYR